MCGDTAETCNIVSTTWDAKSGMSEGGSNIHILMHSIQVINALSYYLPESGYYTLLSTLPQPDPTNPTVTTTYDSQEAIHNGFRILEEIVSTTEIIEEDLFKREVDRRRTRLGAPNLEQLRKEVFLEIYNKSQVL